MAAVRREIEHLPAAALVADNSQRYVAANAAARELTGYTQAEISRLTVMDLTPLSNDETGRRLWGDFISKGGQRGDYELVPKHGAARTVRYWAFASIAPGLHLSLLVPAPRPDGSRR